ncbi:hypothetical protein GQ42DRAFT_165151, partial [Ramicandelaber brevisporus]
KTTPGGTCVCSHRYYRSDWLHEHLCQPDGYLYLASSSRMFHLFPPSWFVPLPLAFSPTSRLLSLVVGC